MLLFLQQPATTDPYHRTNNDRPIAMTPKGNCDIFIFSNFPLFREDPNHQLPGRDNVALTQRNSSTSSSSSLLIIFNQQLTFFSATFPLYWKWLTSLGDPDLFLEQRVSQTNQHLKPASIRHVSQSSLLSSRLEAWFYLTLTSFSCTVRHFNVLSSLILATQDVQRPQKRPKLSKISRNFGTPKPLLRILCTKRCLAAMFDLLHVLPLFQGLCPKFANFVVLSRQPWQFFTTQRPQTFRKCPNSSSLAPKGWNWLQIGQNMHCVLNYGKSRRKVANVLIWPKIIEKLLSFYSLRLYWRSILNLM